MSPYIFRVTRFLLSVTALPFLVPRFSLGTYFSFSVKPARHVNALNTKTKGVLD